MNKQLKDLKIGDKVYCNLNLKCAKNLILTITEITKNEIICGDHHFNRDTGKLKSSFSFEKDPYIDILDKYL